MSFLYKSIFENGANGNANGTAVSATTFTSKFLGLGGFSSPAGDGQGWQSNIFFQIKRSSDGVIDKLHDFWSFAQESSSFMHASSAWKAMIVDEFCSSQVYSDTSEWISSIIERLPCLHMLVDQITHADIASERILEDLDDFADFSDVIRDFIKTFKVLVTFNSVANPQEDFLGSNFGTQHIFQETRSRRRYIG